MKAIIASDTHQNANAIKNIAQFAKQNCISIIFDAGDLHGGIECYEGKKEGIELHAVYWAEACGAMVWHEFSRDIAEIGGTMYDREAAFRLDNALIFMKHDLAGYAKHLSRGQLGYANSKLDDLAATVPAENLTRLVLFGHTHCTYMLNDGISIAINPGHSGRDKRFALVDTDEGFVEFRTLDKILARIDFDSDIKHLREIDENGNYTGRLSNGKEVYVFNGIVSEPFDEILSAEVIDGRALVKAKMVAKKRGKETVKELVAEVLPEGKQKHYGAYAKVFDPISIDGTVVYSAMDGNQLFLVIDGKEQQKHKLTTKNASISEIAIQGNKAAYVLIQGKKHSLFSNELLIAKANEKEYWQGISGIRFVEGKLAYLLNDAGNPSKIIIGEDVALTGDGIRWFDYLTDPATNKKVLVYRKEDDTNIFTEQGVKLGNYYSVERLKSDVEAGKIKLTATNAG